MKRLLLLLALVCGFANAQYYGPVYTPSTVAITGGTITGTTVGGNTFTTGTGTLTLGAGKTTTFDHTSTFTTTDAQTYTFPATSATLARTDAANTFTGTQTIGAAVVTTLNGHTFTTGSSTFTGTAAQTYTFPTTSATLARTDAANTFTGTQTFSGLLTATKNVGITNGDVATNSNSKLFMQGTSTGYNWLIANNNNFAGLEFTPSTATGGTTYSTPTVTMTPLNLTVTGHYVSGGTVPTVATNDCGSSTQGVITAGGNDNGFLVTAGTAAVTSCAITFGTAWTAAPKACSFTPANTTAAAAATVAAYISAISTTKVTISGTALASAAYYVRCW